MTSEMIKRVARALNIALMKHPRFRDSPPFGADLTPLAIAAIEAMRDPTKEMLIQASEQPGQQSYADVWRIMIDTAIADPLTIYHPKQVDRPTEDGEVG